MDRDGVVCWQGDRSECAVVNELYEASSKRRYEDRLGAEVGFNLTDMDNFPDERMTHNEGPIHITFEE